METTKPETFSTMRQNEIEMPFWRLNIGLWGRQSQWNIDQYPVMFSSAWILPIWNHDDHKTGSSYNYASVRDCSNANMASKYRFSRTGKPLEHRTTWSSIKVISSSYKQVTWKHGDHETGSSYYYASERERMQCWCLNIGFRGRQNQWNIDQHQVMFSSAWDLPIWNHDDHKTGSSYNYASLRDWNANVGSKYRFSWTPNSI